MGMVKNSRVSRQPRRTRDKSNRLSYMLRVHTLSTAVHKAPTDAYVNANAQRKKNGMAPSGLSYAKQLYVFISEADVWHAAILLPHLRPSLLPMSL